MQDFLDQWCKVNRWHSRQEEVLLRYDRDGEVFLRFFHVEDGYLRVRFVEPRNVQSPHNGRDHESFGVATDPDDIETVLAYHVDDGWVDASEIQHRKANVDSGCKRGMPLFYPVRKNLARASKILRNVSVATEIQNAIALIRKHQQSTQQTVRTFVKGKADADTKKLDGTDRSVLHYPAGSIIDAPMGQEYDFPKAGINPSKTISALQAELRAVASRLVMPEFMLTSDASNANFSSTMVAEGPAVKKFLREQSTQAEFDREVLDMALAFGVASGLLTEADVAETNIEVGKPSVKVRDELKEAQTAQILSGLGTLSNQTMSAKFGLDYDTEQTNIEAHDERTGAALSGSRPSLVEIPDDPEEPDDKP